MNEGDNQKKEINQLEMPDKIQKLANLYKCFQEKK